MSCVGIAKIAVLYRSVRVSVSVSLPEICELHSCLFANALRDGSQHHIPSPHVATSTALPLAAAADTTILYGLLAVAFTNLPVRVLVRPYSLVIWPLLDCCCSMDSESIFTFRPSKVE